MAVLEDVASVEVYLVVDSEVSMTAEELIAFELAQEVHQALKAVRGVVAIADAVGVRGLGAVTKGEGDVVVEHHELVLRHQAEVALEPGHLFVGQFARLVVGPATVVDDVVEADVVDVTAVERIVSGPPRLFPFLLVEGLAVLVMVADNREETHARRAEGCAHLPLELLVVAAIVLHVIAHADAIYGGTLGQVGYRLLDVGHRLLSEAFDIALAHGVVIRSLEVRAVSVGGLGVANND